jgi:molybdopterin synthase sulfur carrier subunit
MKMIPGEFTLAKESNLRNFLCLKLVKLFLSGVWYARHLANRKMKIKVKAFGVTKDILGGKESVVEMEGMTVGDLRQFLKTRHPQLKGLRSLFIAVNHSYADDSLTLTEHDEIALIPPVSGG